MEVLVEYDYQAQNPDELTIKKGERIRNVVQKEDGWFEGELNNKVGVFPDNFVKIVKSSALNKTQPNFNKISEDKKKNFLNNTIAANGAVNNSSTNGKYVQSVPSISPPPPPPPSSQQQTKAPSSSSVVPPPVNKQRSDYFLARVLYSYIPVNDDELPIQENDTVQVLRLVRAILFF
jgi:hypothetical protein